MNDRKRKKEREERKKIEEQKVCIYISGSCNCSEISKWHCTVPINQLTDTVRITKPADECAARCFSVGGIGKNPAQRRFETHKLCK